jgi:hypothetical protein
VLLVAFFLLRLLLHQAPDHLRGGAGLRDVLASQLGITLGHLDIRVTKNLRKLVEIAAVHHVPGRKRVTEAVEIEYKEALPFSDMILAQCIHPLHFQLTSHDMSSVR